MILGVFPDAGLVAHGSRLALQRFYQHVVPTYDQIWAGGASWCCSATG